MEIRNTTNGSADRPRSADSADVIDFTRLNRERIADSVRELDSRRLEHLRRPPESADLTPAAEKGAQAPKKDRLEVSAGSRALSEGEDPTEVARRLAQVEAVRAAVTEGRLATPELVERAARKLLGG